MILVPRMMDSEQSGQRFPMMVSDEYCHQSTICNLLQASQQGPSVQVMLTQQSASVAQSVSPGHLVEAPGTASTALP